MKYSDKELREIAEAIAVRLFTDSRGFKANRLVLEYNAELCTRCGWAQRPVADQVEKVLRGMLNSYRALPRKKNAASRGKEGTR